MWGFAPPNVSPTSSSVKNYCESVPRFGLYFVVVNCAWALITIGGIPTGRNLSLHSGSPTLQPMMSPICVDHLPHETWPPLSIASWLRNGL